MKLYGFPPSPNTWKVRAVAAHLGLQLELEFLDLSKGQSKTPEFLAINPTGRVPALKLPDGTVMFESAAMLIHLAAAHPQHPLAPQPGSTSHAAFLQWMVFLSANVYEAAPRSRKPWTMRSNGFSCSFQGRTSPPT